MFITALFTIVLSYGNNQDTPLLMNGLRKCGIPFIMEFYSATNKNGFPSSKDYRHEPP
jgi:hypothetical protein